MAFTMSVRQFFDVRDNALRLCSKSELLREFGRHTPRIPEYDPCRSAVMDLSSRLVYGVGFGRGASEIKGSGKATQQGRELLFLDPSVNFDDIFSFSGLELIKHSIITNGKVCGKFKRDLKISLDKLKAEKIERYTQCLRGIDNLKQELEPFRNSDGMQS